MLQKAGQLRVSQLPERCNPLQKQLVTAYCDYPKKLTDFAGLRVNENATHGNLD